MITHEQTQVNMLMSFYELFSNKSNSLDITHDLLYTMYMVKQSSKENEMDKRISKLQPGQSIEISRSKGQWVTVERSGNGKVVRFVRHNPNGFVVFKKVHDFELLECYNG